jgi:hypothetical protein
MIKLLRKTLITIFSVGNSYFLPDIHLLRSDGKVTCVILITSIIGILSPLLELYSLLAALNGHALGNFRVEMATYGLLVLSTVLWVVLYLLTRTQPGIYLKSMHPRKDPAYRFLIILMWAFGIVVIAHQGLEITINLSCFKRYENDAIGFAYMIKAIGRIFFILFIFIQSLSAVKFIQYELRRNIFVNYSLSVIFTTNIAIWMFTSWREVYMEIVENSRHQFHNASEVIICHWNSSIYRHILLNLKHFIFPTQLEYCLLSALFVTSIFPPVSACTKRWRTCDDSRNPDHGVGFQRYSAAVVMSVIVFFPTLLVFILQQHSESSAEYFDLSCVLCTFIPVSVMIVVTYRGFHVLRMSPLLLDHDSFHGHVFNSDVMLIFSSMGNVSYCVLVLLSTAQHKYFHFFFIRYVCGILEIFLQTVFLVLLRRYPKHIYKQMKGALSFLCVANLLYWGFDEYVFRFQHPHKVLGSSWPSVRKFVLTFVSFYRFQSFIYLYRACKT